MTERWHMHCHIAEHLGAGMDCSKGALTATFAV